MSGSEWVGRSVAKGTDIGGRSTPQNWGVEILHFYLHRDIWNDPSG
jgi:hypothetical protein